MAPPGTGGRAFDYQTGGNLQYMPRANETISFQQLRAFADNLPELRLVIETRKDQMAAWEWDIQPVLDVGGDANSKAVDDPRIAEIKKFFRRPDRENTFHVWFRMLVEDMLVIDAATIYPRRTLNGKLGSLEVIDGSTITKLIDGTGRLPLPPSPAYQQIIKGVVASDFTFDELLYNPRNKRSNKLYGYSPVEQIVLTVNIAIRRAIFTLTYYQEGTLPDAFGNLPKEWNAQQVKDFQNYFDSLLTDNLADRRKMRFMPGDFKYQEVRQPPLKDLYDEWLIKIICFAFSISPTPFINQANRATAQTLHVQAAQEGELPLKLWGKDIFDNIIQNLMGFEDLEFVWTGDDNLDPLEQAQTSQIYQTIGVLDINEIRKSLGLEPLDDSELALRRTNLAPTPPSPDASTADGVKLDGVKPAQGGQGVGKRAKIPFRSVSPAAMDRPAVIKATAKTKKLWKKALKALADTLATKIRATVSKLAKADDVPDPEAERALRDEIDGMIEEFGLTLDSSQQADLEDLLVTIAEDSAGIAYSGIMLGEVDQGIFDQMHQAAVDWASDHAAELVSNVTETTIQDIRDAVVSGLSDGLTKDEIADLIQELPSFSADRADLIASTEIGNANSQGSLQGYRQAESDGANVKKVWLLTDDACDECVDNADAGPIDLDEDFPSGDPCPLAHPRCRCALSASVEDTLNTDQTDDQIEE
jgi:hypothetical protein